jgi:hypothetical protein
MNSSYARPKWWLLYLSFPLLILLFAFDHGLKISMQGHEAVQFAIILLVYALIYWWLKANSKAISRMDQKYHRGRVMIIPISISPLPKVDDEVLQEMNKQ